MPQPANPPPPDVTGGHPADPGRVPPPAAEPEPLVSLKPRNARPTPEPLEGDPVRIVAIGTALWFAGFVVLLLMRGRLAAAGNEFWVWTCLVGGLLGLLGLVLARRARSRR